MHRAWSDEADTLIAARFTDVGRIVQIGDIEQRRLRFGDDVGQTSAVLGQIHRGESTTGVTVHRRPASIQVVFQRLGLVEQVRVVTAQFLPGRGFRPPEIRRRKRSNEKLEREKLRPDITRTTVGWSVA